MNSIGFNTDKDATAFLRSAAPDVLLQVHFWVGLARWDMNCFSREST